MVNFYIILAVLIQVTLTYGEIDVEEFENKTEVYNVPDLNDEEVKDYHHESDEDWMDAFLGPDTNLFPSSSTVAMAQVVSSEKSPEEQLEDIKEMATQITNSIQSEMANLLTYALSITDKETDDKESRKKRSADTPMDSTKLVWRLLKHIKSNNEYQNIAIEKMMSAQEIADKYGIEFTPDTEILAELAVAANDQAKELTSILKEACDLKNATQIDSCPNAANQETQIDYPENVTYHIHTIPDFVKQTNNNFPSTFTYDEHILTQPEMDHIHYSDPYSKYNFYYSSPESQIPPPPVHEHHTCPPVSQKQNFYDTVSYGAQDYYAPYCSMEPLSGGFILPIDDFYEPEPELVGEELEETISSKVYIDHNAEPGSSTVNHVMTYTISEKSHYRTPQIDSLPQQMQYYFLLV